MAYKFITSTKPFPEVVEVTLNRPDAANALNKQMADELADCINRQASEARAVILTGSGQRAFCAGADLKERMNMNEAEWEEQHKSFRAARDAILNAPVPIIAAVNGAAFGGGLELALVCDFIYASDNARFGLPEARLGIIPGLGGTQTLARSIGERRAKEILYSARIFTAEEAFSWGMLNLVISIDQLLPEVHKVAQAITTMAPLSIIALKKVVSDGFQETLADGLGIERDEYLKLIGSKDRHEGIAAFNEKRPAVFKGI